MEFETWWLLGVPLFFALGWIAARIDIRHVINESRSLPSNYYKGLNEMKILILRLKSLLILRG